ncbi:hypothetical protein EMPG_17495 [Blastomyces silverae]|uniref:F-box domain-containing protein n=1 Tax=Blastomyces silverae TaxID=2060906 RepID=A0A0H1B6K6_9EURO|nr:hypothetical protein EMPG_17495 [Blastomyces silverae]
MAPGIGHRRLRPARFKLERYTQHDLAAIPPPEPSVPPSDSTRPPADGGNLVSRLPPELTTTILLYLDLNSLLTLRLINTLYRTLIDSLHPYTLLKQHAPHTLRILHKVQLASHFPLHQLYSEFRHPHCRACGAFGPLVFLPTLTRCCHRCLWTRARFQVARIGFLVDHLVDQFPGDLAPEELEALVALLKQLPTVHVFPGAYGRDPLHFDIIDEPIGLVSIAEAEKATVKWLGTHERFRESIASLKAPRLGQGQSQSQGQGQGQDQDQGRTESSINIPRLMEIYEMARSRWMGTGATDLPYWDAQRQMAESGIYCSPCALQREYENRYEQDEGMGEEGQGDTLIWDGDDGTDARNTTGPRVDNAAFYMGDICRHFEECELLRKGYVFGMKDGMTRGIGNGPDFWINADGCIVYDRD